MIICTKCQRTYNPLAFFGPYRNQVPIFSGSLLRNSTISHSAGMLKPYNRSITNIKKVQPAPHWGVLTFIYKKIITQGENEYENARQWRTGFPRAADFRFERPQMKGELKMLNVKLERYLNTFWRKDEAKSFASLSELENWIFDQMQQDYSRNTWAMSFPTPASARNIHADGPWAIKFQPIPGETTISIHQIESSEGIIFSDGRRTAGRKYWTDEVQAWLTHCEQRRRVPQFNFASGEKPLTRKLWARLGVSLRITAEEEAVIFGADETLSEETIRKIILDGRFTPDGDSYVPETAAEQFNEDYGTNHPVRDIGFEM